MPREPRALVFDLDDTVYPYRRFVRSGFAAVARHLATAAQLDVRDVFATLMRASRQGDRGAELQACLCAYGLELSRLPALLAIFRGHRPRLTLPAHVAATLAALRSSGWRLGVLTNGWPEVQARKVDALGLRSRVDGIVFATEHGPGKPDPGAFAEILRQLDVAARGAVFVGDDETCDVRGALAAGLGAIHFTRWRASSARSAAHATVGRWPQIPGAAAQVLGARRAHAA
ncbi:MAG: HAD family hydrolase [Acidobacteria bacterium]|nr:HAD family hydrolase [Acidobacteriota bacterium]